MFAMLETQALTRRFGAFTAVDGLTITVEAGEIFGLLGPNGAGKSTTIKMLTTLLPPTSGRAWVAGFDITRQAEAVRRSIGYVPQMLSADGSLTGYENLLLSARLYDIPGAICAARIQEALALMGLENAAHQLVRTYSGGMIRRLEIAQSLLHRPQVLFLDEPTVGLDPIARKSLWEHMHTLQTAYEMTIVLTTHLMDEADNLCNRIAIMHHGTLAVIGTPRDLKQGLGGNGVTLDDVFVHYTGDYLETGGGYRETARARRTARRVG